MGSAVRRWRCLFLHPYMPVAAASSELSKRTLGCRVCVFPAQVWQLCTTFRIEYLQRLRPRFLRVAEVCGQGTFGSTISQRLKSKVPASLGGHTASVLISFLSRMPCHCDGSKTKKKKKKKKTLVLIPLLKKKKKKKKKKS